MKQDPKALLEDLCKGADPRKDRSLRLIYSICEEQHKRGSKDYSVATIGKLSLEAGGPSPASIRNKTGESYRALIKLFAESVGGKNRKMAESVETDADKILEGVTDPVLRTRIGLLLAELESTRAQLLAARHIANQNSVVNLADYPRIGSENATSLGSDAVEVIPASESLTTLEVRALKAAISNETMNHWGWHIDESGRVLTDTGQQVFGAGFVSAIQKALK